MGMTEAWLRSRRMTTTRTTWTGMSESRQPGAGARASAYCPESEGDALVQLNG
jgi:hypothetical protein